MWVGSGKVPDVSWYGCSKFNLGSHHICLSTNHMMEICQGHCVCNGNTNMAYKSQRDVTSACVRADGVDGYCLVLLLGNGRVTLWCNRGYEHICHSPSLYLKEKRGHWSLWGWGGGGDWGMGPASPLTLSSPLSWPCCSSHTQRSAVAPWSFSTQYNGRRRSSRGLHPNCFLSLLVCFLSEVMNGHRGLRSCLRSGGHFYETKILMGDPWRSSRPERRQT